MAGFTYAEAEYIGDKDLLARIRKAEEKAGVQTGVRHAHQDGKFVAYRVSVNFYPKTKFSIEDQAPDGSYVNRRDLTDEEYGNTHGLKL